MSQTSDEPFIMAEHLPDEDSLPCDSDDGETQTSCYISPEASTFSGNYHSIATSTSVPSSDMFHSLASRTEDSDSDDTSMDDVDLMSEIHGALEEGYIGLDLGTLHRTLPRQLWSRHEKRKPPEKYQPSKDIGRYKSSMKHFIPVRKSKKEREEMPLDSAGCFSFITFSWVTRYMMKAYRHGLQPEDVPLCSTVDGCEQSSLRLEHMWKDELARKGAENASFFSVAVRFIRTRAIVQMIAYCFSLLVGFMGPIVFMKRLLEFAEDVESPWWYGAIWAAGVTLNELCRTLSFAVQWSICYRTGIRLRSACLTLLYKKVMHLSSLGNKSVGELINLFANDGSRIFNFACLAPMLIGGPVVAVMGAAYILWLLGPHALIGMLTFAAFYPIQYGISRMTSYFRRRTVLVTDQRVRLMHELVSCVKLIKMYAWEKPFSRTIMDIRSKERKLLEKSAYVQSLSIALTPAVPIIATIATFLSHIAAGNNLTAAEAFTAWCVFDVLSIPGYVLPSGVSAIVEARVALKRFQAFVTVGVFNAIRVGLSGFPYSVTSIADFRVAHERFKAFAIVAFMNTRVRPSLNITREALKSLDEARVAWKRFKSVLTMEEMSYYTQKPFDKTVAVSMAEAKLAWNAAETQRKQRKEQRKKLRKGDKGSGAEKQALNGGGPDPASSPAGPVTVLHGVNIRVTKGRLVAICGSVGSGKSSLLSAILGQMRLQGGTVAVDGSVAYVPQQAWVMNSSVKDNILFGEAFDPKRYYNVIWNCALNHDIATLPAGDETEVGERGINLSGGQRQRLAMARALYANREIYLLDDPLSAVDAHVGKHIFVNCIKTALKGKTVIFVTHQLQYLSQCDEVAFMADGRVVDVAPHDSLMKRNPQYQDLIITFLREHEDGQSSSGDETDAKEAANGTISPVGSAKVAPNRSISVSSAQSGGGEKPPAVPLVDSSIAKQPEAGRITADEKIEEGSVPWTTYHSFIQYGGGYIAAFFVLCAFIINVSSTTFSSYWLAHWINAGSGSASNVSSAEFNETELNATEFSKPVKSNRINDNPDLPFYQLVYGLFLIAILVSSLVRGVFFMKMMLRASSTLHNLLFVKVFRSPMRFFDATPIGRILNLFSKDMDETDCRLSDTLENFIQGFFVILSALLFMMLVFPWFIVPFVFIAALFVYICRIYRIGIRDLKRLENASRSPVYSHVAATVNGLSTLHAFSKEREFITRFMLLTDENTSIFFLFQGSMRWLAVRLDIVTVICLGASAFFVVILHGQVSAAFAGLAMAYALNISGMLQFTVRLFSEAEARFTSVQRMQNHIKTLESEAPAVIENRRPAENWPRFGSIRFMNVKMKYRPDLPLVLKGITIDIEPNEKIGIVGRTGSGKSSLGMALFRLVELTSGSIKVDGINIAEIGLEDLRSKLSIIPQDPVLFIGTIRYNLDPFHAYSDAAIWEALEQTNMKDRVVSLPEKLESPVVENGENFSVGERQLLCMARALLRHSKILLLDEATAAIDTQTDSLVQQTLRQAFKDCTLLTIAHRLNTVLYCDRILVLDDGKVVEFDKPSVLLSRPHSAFSNMMAAAETSVQQLALST